MNLNISATTVKYFFQYRCERQVRYRMIPPGGLAAVPVVVAADERQPWALAGDEYEAELVAALASVLRPATGEFALSADQTRSFLTQAGPERYAHQLRLELPEPDQLPPALAGRWGLPPTVHLSPALPDLVEVVPPGDHSGGGLRIIDVKAVTHPTLFHRAQVAFYALLLEAVLSLHELHVPVLPEAEIWHRDPNGGPDPVRSAFRLAGYKAQVADFLGRTVPRLAATPVGPGDDRTRFLVYFKCEQCPFLPHCRRSVADDVPPAALDLSAVPGVSWATKYTLIDAIGVASVGDLAGQSAAGDRDAVPEVELRRHPRANWMLRSAGEVLVHRARALVDGRVTRLPGRYTHQMPAEFDLGIYLLVDHDPVEGRLAMVGCRVEWPGLAAAEVVEPVTAPGPAAERAAVARVLAAVVAALDAADAHNAAGAGEAVRAHLFLYEPREAIDLAAALGRHLADAGVRRGLLHMLRMFPPDHLPPEPAYRGVQHLPTTALRGVVEATLAVPARVSHDLRSVTAALAAAGQPPLADAYQPAERFARPFSSRLNIDACRDLKSGRLPPAKAADDARARLAAMASLARWLAAASAAELDGGFLRLRKEPFRWQATMDPLAADDVDLLRAHEQLQERTAELSALVALAAPWQVRRDRFRCFAAMRLLDWGNSPSPLADLRLRLAVPPASHKAELMPGAVGLILTNDDPDLRLDPRTWSGVFASLIEVRRRAGAVELVVDVEQGGPVWDDLLARTPDDGWFLDAAHRDLNGDRMEQFLAYLGNGARPA